MTASLRTLLAAIALLLCTCTEWRDHVTLNGVHFARAKVTRGNLVIGELAHDTLIAGRMCSRGWVHVYPNGVAAAFTAAEPIRLPRLTIPLGTWVMQNIEGTLMTCAFPRDALVQGHPCRGTGGPSGVQAAFYASGALKQFYPPRDTRIDGVPCRANVFNGWIELHENGRLKSCLLDDDWYGDGVRYRRGTRLDLAADGHPLPPPPPPFFDPTAA